MNSMTRSASRGQVIVGLRVLAAALEADPTLRVPWFCTATSSSQYVHSREEMAAWVALLDDPVEVGVAPGSDYYTVEGRIGGVRLSVKALANELGRTVRREVETFEVEPFLTGVTA